LVQSISTLSEIDSNISTAAEQTFRSNRIYNKSGITNLFGVSPTNVFRVKPCIKPNSKIKFASSQSFLKTWMTSKKRFALLNEKLQKLYLSHSLFPVFNYKEAKIMLLVALLLDVKIS